MARFYNTGQTNFIDFTQSNRPGKATVQSPFGAIEALPEDRARLEQLVNEYDSQIGGITEQLRRNPSAAKSLQPEIAGLGQNIRDNYYYGEIAAIRDRYNQYASQVKSIQETLKDQPYLQDAAIRAIQVPELGFDPMTRNYNKLISPDVVKPFTEDAKWVANANQVVKDEILSKVDATRKLDDFTSLLELGQNVGVTKQKVVDTLVGLVTPDMLRSAQQERTLRGDNSVDETKFYDPATGQLNTDTVWGQKIASLAEGLSRRNYKGQNIKYEDKKGLEKLKSNLRKGEAKYKNRLDNQDAISMADKLRAIWKGEESTFSGVTEPGTGELGGTSYAAPVRKDDFLKDIKTQNGSVIKEVGKPIGGQPYVVVEVDNNGIKKQERYPLDIDFIRNAFGDKFASQVTDELGTDYNPKDASINIDFTQDVTVDNTPTNIPGLDE